MGFGGLTLMPQSPAYDAGPFTSPAALGGAPGTPRGRGVSTDGPMSPGGAAAAALPLAMQLPGMVPMMQFGMPMLAGAAAPGSPVACPLAFAGDFGAPPTATAADVPAPELPPGVKRLKAAHGLGCDAGSPASPVTPGAAGFGPGSVTAASWAAASPSPRAGGAGAPRVPFAGGAFGDCGSAAPTPRGFVPCGGGGDACGGSATAAAAACGGGGAFFVPHALRAECFGPSDGGAPSTAEGRSSLASGATVADGVMSPVASAAPRPSGHSPLAAASWAAAAPPQEPAPAAAPAACGAQPQPASAGAAAAPPQEPHSSVDLMLDSLAAGCPWAENLDCDLDLPPAHAALLEEMLRV
jgi:hypothetical protein